MAKYIDLDKFLDETSIWLYEGGTPVVPLEELKAESTADVVPKSEVEKIFAEIETCMKDFEDDDDGYLLKKCEFEFFMREIRDKYTESENGRANSEM